MRLTGPAAVVALLCAAPDFADAEPMELSDQSACDQILSATVGPARRVLTDHGIEFRADLPIELEIALINRAVLLLLAQDLFAGDAVILEIYASAASECSPAIGNPFSEFLNR